MDYQENKQQQNGEYRGGRGGRGRGGRGNRGNNRGKGRGGKEYQDKEYTDNKQEVIKEKPKIIEKKIELNANDWMAMFQGEKAENYEKQKEDEKQKEAEELKVKEEQRLKEEADKKAVLDAQQKEKKLLEKKQEKAEIKENTTKLNGKKEVKKESKDGEDQKDEEEKDTGDKKEEEKKEEKPKPAMNDWSALESFWQETGQNKNKKPTVIKYVKSETGGAKLNNLDINLKLTEDLQFSMTNFDKVNKGLANQDINCFMNVCLQSLMACPAFFNMLTVVSENQENECFSKDKDVLTKFVELSRYFEPRIQVMSSKQGAEIYKKKIVDAQEIFMKELYDFNPENIQADTSEFFSYIMDKLHEELKGIYVSNQKEENKNNDKKVNGNLDWNETGQDNKKITFQNHELLVMIEKSIVRDIFGGIMRNEFHVDGSRNSSVTFEPLFVLNLPIVYDECTIEECMDQYFQKSYVEGYKQNGRVVNAHNQMVFEKLPNILVINLKRFVYTDRLIKKKEHVYFENTLTIEDAHVSPQLQLGIFKQSSQAGSLRKYRLFSVVEHIGTQANRGHYVCYTLDSKNDWIKFDDKKWSQRDYQDIKNDAQAYLLFYELMQD